MKNVLFITLDQFRGDAMSSVGHPFVKTPVLDALAKRGFQLRRHYSQSAPCSPGRAALYTGTYQMNNRVVANGTPHPSNFDNVAYAARRAGYNPYLFGYTDQGLNPRAAVDEDDVRLSYYDGILPGFSIGCYLPEDQSPWRQWLMELGYDVPVGYAAALRGEPDRPAEVSLSAFLTNRFLDWLPKQESGWFAHLSYLRPHPPYAAAGEFSKRFHPDDVDLPISAVEESMRHPLHALAMANEASASPSDEGDLRRLRTQYFGMVEEVDSQLGRVIDAITARGELDQTLIVVTADHGEQLGDHGLLEKLAFYPQSYNILGIWCDPTLGSGVVDQFTENVDLFPTLCESMDIAIPRQCDGRSLLPLFNGTAKEWRSAAHYEWDWRYFFIGSRTPQWSENRLLSRQNLAVSVGEELAYVQFGDGSYKAFDLVADPTWRTECLDADRVLKGAQELLVWRQEHLRRDETDMLLVPSRAGHWPSIGLARA